VYERYQVPGPGGILFEGALASFKPHSAFRVDYDKKDRAPLLFIAGGNDHIVPAAVNLANVKKYKSGIVDYKEFAGRSHFTVARTAGRKSPTTRATGPRRRPVRRRRRNFTSGR
jgi:dienelactone hydrolase